MLDIKIIPCLNDNYSYIIHDTDSKLTGVIDPSEFKPIDKYLENNFNRLDFIFNTHHHFDHVGGNIELKKKYKSKIAASEVEKNKTPGIDILLKSNKILRFGNIKFKIIFIPGHTIGHIGFYSKEENVIFTGDTIFSLGCGKVFEGTSKQMLNSINKIKLLPITTKIYCGHEYTKNNFNFCIKHDKDNLKLLNKLDWINQKISKKIPTVPTTLEEELATNIFLRCDNIAIKNSLGMNDSSEELIFEKLRNLKDVF